MENKITIREMKIEDYAQVWQLWSSTEGVGLSDADTQENISLFLKRNAGLSFVAETGGQEIVGAILCGHDGRRGYLHHLTVNAAYRRNGIGRRLVENCFRRLKQAGIRKCHLFVFKDNHLGMNFWHKTGFLTRNDLHILSRDV
ncbi:acyl-coa n-acyltransferase [Lucifera butyrica]|uniref:Acyl-coa n-acyltransferase n=1 Tax=Lucifera butyrica TaxID=1351585 RepID=A0A498R6P0_9FIRM|nr:N-acetyltransferase [Lucifera butyrica]VBB06735.1 acyl-coa n-acyltransferase [Lucifera butyrica]